MISPAWWHWTCTSDSVEIQLCGWNTSLHPVGTRAECSENWCSMGKQFYFWNQMLSVSNSQWNCLPLHFLCASRLSKKDNVVDVWEEKTVILARKLGRRNDRTSRCSPVHCHFSLFLHGMNNNDNNNNNNNNNNN